KEGNTARRDTIRLASPMAATVEKSLAERKPRSVFDLPSGFFDSCRLLRSLQSETLRRIPDPSPVTAETGVAGSVGEGVEVEVESVLSGEMGKEAGALSSRWTCNTCKAEFDSLQDQRSHFKSDLHRLNVSTTLFLLILAPISFVSEELAPSMLPAPMGMDKAQQDGGMEASFLVRLQKWWRLQTHIGMEQVKLSIAGKNIIKEDDFDNLGGDPVYEDFDVSSISGSEDEFENDAIHHSSLSSKGKERDKQKLCFYLQSGDIVSVWRCLLMDESEDISFENNKSNHMVSRDAYLEETELINRLKTLVCEPRDTSHLRIVLLASGGHFAGCVFDGNFVVAHKTFHRSVQFILSAFSFLYVVRAKAGKRQSAKDATGKAANSAGSSLRRYNEAALKKAEKDAKRKAKTKELKKLRKAKEKAKAQAAVSENASAAVSHNQGASSASAHRQQPQSNQPVLSKEVKQRKILIYRTIIFDAHRLSNWRTVSHDQEEQRRALAAEREKRAAAAEKRIAALNARLTSTTVAPQSSSAPKSGDGDVICSCCNASLDGKVPFHRYDYKYCSTSCMHVHRELLEDG
ncbi:hypothetical protein BHM03_00037898, partial [Ensete ventricosum]